MEGKPLTLPLGRRLFKCGVLGKSLQEPGGTKDSVTGAGSAAQLWRPRVKEQHSSEYSGLTHKQLQAHVNAAGHTGMTQSNCPFFLI